MSRRPVLQALVIADHVYQDKATGKRIIAGTFANYYGTITKRRDGTSSPEEVTPETANKLGPAGMQHTAGSAYAYISLTDIRNKVELELRLVALSNNQVLCRANCQVGCNDPLQIVEFFVPLPAPNFPDYGTYAWELLWEDELLGSWRINMKPISDFGKDRANQ